MSSLMKAMIAAVIGGLYWGGEKSPSSQASPVHGEIGVDVRMGVIGEDIPDELVDIVTVGDGIVAGVSKPDGSLLAICVFNDVMISGVTEEDAEMAVRDIAANGVLTTSLSERVSYTCVR